MIKHFCDRCGREIHRLNTRTYVQLRDEIGDTPDNAKPEYELCESCEEKLVKFLEVKDAT